MRVFSHDGESQVLQSVTEVRLVHGGEARRFKVLRKRRSNKFYILSLEGVVDRDGAQELNGSEVEIDPEMLPELSEEEFYHHELVGLPVEDGQGEGIGILEEVLDTGGHDTLVVRDRDKGFEYMVPFVASMVEVDEDRGAVVLTLPQGLLEATEEPIGGL
jgi:16S rRNA processing protein RimM